MLGNHQSFHRIHHQIQNKRLDPQRKPAQPERPNKLCWLPAGQLQDQPMKPVVCRPKLGHSPALDRPFVLESLVGPERPEEKRLLGPRETGRLLRQSVELGLVAVPALLWLRQLERPEPPGPPVRIRRKLRPAQLVPLEKFVRPGPVLLLQSLGPAGQPEQLGPQGSPSLAGQPELQRHIVRSVLPWRYWQPVGRWQQHLRNLLRNH